MRTEEELYSPDGDSISCFIHIYIYLYSFLYVLNPLVLWSACSAFWGDIGFSWGYWGYSQHSKARETERNKKDQKWPKELRENKKIFKKINLLTFLLFDSASTDAHWLVVLEEPRPRAVNIRVGGGSDRGLAWSDWLGCKNTDIKMNSDLLSMHWGHVTK